jgi:hypothetical protein
MCLRYREGVWDWHVASEEDVRYVQATKDMLDGIAKSYGKGICPGMSEVFGSHCTDNISVYINTRVT